MSQNEDTMKWRKRPQGPASPSPGQQQQNPNHNQQRRTDSRDRTNFPSPATPTNSRNSGTWNGVDDHVPVNGFNAKEVRDLLNNAYNIAHAAALEKGDDKDKPVIYKGTDSGWTTQSKSTSPWGPKQHVMANGQDFLTKLKKGVAALSSGTSASGTPKLEGKA